MPIGKKMPKMKKAAKKKPAAKKRAVARPEPEEVDFRKVTLPPEVTAPFQLSYRNAYHNSSTTITVRPWTPQEIEKRCTVVQPLFVVNVVPDDGGPGSEYGFALRKTVTYMYTMRSGYGYTTMACYVFYLWAYMSRQTDSRILTFCDDHDWADMYIDRVPYSTIAQAFVENLRSQVEWWRSSRVSSLIINELPDPKKSAKKSAKKAGLVKARHG